MATKTDQDNRYQVSSVKIKTHVYEMKVVNKTTDVAIIRNGQFAIGVTSKCFYKLLL